MRVWKQPLGVWVLGATISAGAAVAEAQPKETQTGKTDAPAAAENQQARNPVKPTIRDPGIGAAAAGFDIAPGKTGGDAEREAPTATPASGSQPAAAPNDAFSSELANLLRCRYQVAMEQRKSPAQVRAGRMLVRFDVDHSGSVVEPTVVALEPTTPEVLTCVTRDIQGWQMTPAPGQRMRIETEVGASGPSNEQGSNANPAAQAKTGIALE